MSRTLHRACSPGLHAVALVAVGMSIASVATAQQQTSPSDLAIQQRQATVAAAGDRTAIAAEIVSKWAAKGGELGFTTGWDTELTRALLAMRADRLLLAKSATTYRELVAVVSGLNPSTQRAGAAPSTSLDSKATANDFFGDEWDNLVYFPLTPCRIIDTRGVGGAFVNGNVRQYLADANFSVQGGNPLDCPGITVDDEPAAIAVNITIAGATGSGHLRVYPEGAALPGASIINWGPGNTLANSTIITLGQYVGADFRIAMFGTGSVHVIVDILGYFWSPKASEVYTWPYSLTQSVPAGTNWSLNPACPFGTAMAGGFATDLSYVPSGAGSLAITENAPDGYYGWSCRGTNNTIYSMNVYCRLVCALTPGR